MTAFDDASTQRNELTPEQQAARALHPSTGMTPVVAAKTGTKWQIFAWSLWDWGAAAFQTVATTFVFSIYITSEYFGKPSENSEKLGVAMLYAGLFIAVFAPMIGRVTDALGKRKTWLAITTSFTVLLTAMTVFVAPEKQYLTFGLVILAVGTVMSELASVSYNAMLGQISTVKNVGKISGFGWAMGYIGGIVLLGILLIGFIFPDHGWFGVTHEDAWNVRIGMLLTAVWFAVFALPVLIAIPEVQMPKHPLPLGKAVLRSYGDLFRTLRGLWKVSPKTVMFLVSSAVFRDGLAGVFTFGGVIAAHSFGFSQTQVIIFAIAANLVAGIATFALGFLEHVIGPKLIILGSLLLMVVCGLMIFILHSEGPIIFWTFGLALCLFVGPIQSSARSYLTRITPPGSEGEMFGLYTTTGRAVSFLAPALFAFTVNLGGETIWGILGLAVVLLVGALLLVPMPNKSQLADHDKR